MPANPVMLIGGYSTAPPLKGANPSTLTGLLDEVRLWTMARSSAEIASFMHDTLITPMDQLAIYFRFDGQSEHKSPKVCSEVNGVKAYKGCDSDVAEIASPVSQTGPPMGCGPPAPPGDRTLLNPDYFHTSFNPSMGSFVREDPEDCGPDHNSCERRRGGETGGEGERRRDGRGGGEEEGEGRRGGGKKMTRADGGRREQGIAGDDDVQKRVVEGRGLGRGERRREGENGGAGRGGKERERGEKGERRREGRERRGVEGLDVTQVTEGHTLILTTTEPASTDGRGRMRDVEEEFEVLEAPAIAETRDEEGKETQGERSLYNPDI
eukprot:762131-Hanusia_phi.AAC.1